MPDKKEKLILLSDVPGGCPRAAGEPIVMPSGPVLLSVAIHSMCGTNSRLELGFDQIHAGNTAQRLCPSMVASSSGFAQVVLHEPPSGPIRWTATVTSSGRDAVTLIAVKMVPLGEAA